MHNPDDLSLYYYDGCPWCGRVTSALQRLGVSVDMRNILSEPQHLRELMEARGRRTVPVLRVRGEGGRDQWMPESADIVAYLEKRFGSK
ncbi:MAG: glutaredoxin [Myxococcota bacterium]|nr:glutaredoxin [Myxococcota bacterium]